MESSIDEAHHLNLNRLFDIGINDDKMSPTLNHGKRITLKKVLDLSKIEIGGIYYIERLKSSSFIGRLVSGDEWEFDNSKYKSFKFEASTTDKVIAKVTKKQILSFSNSLTIINMKSKNESKKKLYLKISQRLKEARLRKELTAVEVSLKLRTKKSAVSHYENGTNSPTILNLIKLCVLYKTSPSYILGFDDEFVTYNESYMINLKRIFQMNNADNTSEGFEK